MEFLGIVTRLQNQSNQDYYYYDSRIDEVVVKDGLNNIIGGEDNER